MREGDNKIETGRGIGGEIRIKQRRVKYIRTYLTLPNQIVPGQANFIETMKFNSDPDIYRERKKERQSQGEREREKEAEIDSRDRMC